MMMKFMAYNKTFPKLYLQPVKEEVFKQEKERHIMVMVMIMSKSLMM